MKLIALALASMLVMPLVACGSSSEKAYDTYQECFDDHTEKEHLINSEAITVCCLDHEIGGVKQVCGATEADCINYITANLKQTSASTTEVQFGCSEYEMQKTM